MKIKLFLLLLLFFPVFVNSQDLVNCNDSTSYYIKTKFEKNFYIRLFGQVKFSDNPNVVILNNYYCVQTLVAKKNNYLSSGSNEIAILTEYLFSETQYFSQLFKSKLELYAEPFEIEKDRKAVVWYYNIPRSIKGEKKDGAFSAINQVSISTILDTYIFSISITQFENQTFDEIKEILYELIKTAGYSNSELNKNDLCN